VTAALTGVDPTVDGLGFFVGIVGASAFWIAAARESCAWGLVFLGAIGALIGLENLSGDHGHTALGFVVLALGVGLYCWAGRGG